MYLCVTEKVFVVPSFQVKDIKDFLFYWKFFNMMQLLLYSDGYVT